MPFCGERKWFNSAWTLSLPPHQPDSRIPPSLSAPLDKPPKWCRRCRPPPSQLATCCSWNFNFNFNGKVKFLLKLLRRHQQKLLQLAQLATASGFWFHVGSCSWSWRWRWSWKNRQQRRNPHLLMLLSRNQMSVCSSLFKLGITNALVIYVSSLFVWRFCAGGRWIRVLNMHI